MKIIYILIILIIIYFILNKKEKFTSLEDNIDYHLIKMLEDVNSLFNHFGIFYWIDGPTLLDAHYFRRINPKSYNANICILSKDKILFLYLARYFYQMGYGLAKFWGGYKLYPLNGVNPTYFNRSYKINEYNLDERDNYDYKFPTVTVFFCRQFENIYHFSNKYLRNKLKNNYHAKKDLLPLRLYRLNSIYVYGPNDPTNYIKRNYN